MERFLSTMRMHNIILCTVVLSLLCVTHGYRKKYKRQTSKEFDVLIFTQRWPLTACFVWKENSESHSCSLPKREEWTIHGIWPTKFHTIGPQYCNNSLPFDAKTLETIEEQLKENWIDIQKGSKPYTFWKHEWNKHGTCAITIKALDNEYNYFSAGLKLLDTYNMIDVLAKANILPGHSYVVQDILAGIEKVLGKRAQVMCAKNEKTDESYVVEIRICFDKTLQLVDCDGISGFPTNCKKHEPIIYPSNVPHYNAIQI